MSIHEVLTDIVKVNSPKFTADSINVSTLSIEKYETGIRELENEIKRMKRGINKNRWVKETMRKPRGY